MQGTLPVARGVQAYADRSFNEVRFDPLVHLNISNPDTATLLDFSTVDIKGNQRAFLGGNPQHRASPVALLGAPPAPIDLRTGHPTGQSCLAFTSSFNVLSPAGVAAMRTVIANNQDLVRGNARAPRHLRGLAYTSQFVRDLSESPAILAHVSRLAGIPLVPHYMHGSACHTNLSSDDKFYESLKNTKKSVDAFHVDSCPFVLIIICSDMTGMQGGVLQAVRRKGLPAARAAVAAGLDEEKDLLEVDYLGAGGALFMQGSEILHRVTNVTKAREPRISVVLSFMPASCVHLGDTTSIGSWLNGMDGQSFYPEAAFEFARGRAHRAEQQMRYFVSQMPFTEDRMLLAEQLERTAKELSDAAASLKGERNDYLGFVTDAEVESGKKKREGQVKHSKL